MKRRPAENIVEVMLVKETIEESDLALVEECRNGDSSAFTRLVDSNKNRVYNVAYRFLGNHEDAQDVAQEVFVRAYQRLDSFAGASKIYTWLYSITSNLAKNKLRDSNRKGRNMGRSLEAFAEHAPDAAQAATSTNQTPADVARGHELDERLQECLAELPEHYRMTFVLRTFEKLTYEEIAEAMACPKGTVKSRLNQARTMLHARLKEMSLI